MKFSNRAAVLTTVAVTVALANTASAHGFAGARFFPATLSTDDPFVNDELSLPTVSTIKTPEGWETAITADIAKRITPNLGIEIGEEFIDLNPNDETKSADLVTLSLVQNISSSRVPNTRRFSHLAQKWRSAGQDKIASARRVSARGRQHFSLAKAWAICPTRFHCCVPLLSLVWSASRFQPVSAVE